MHFPLISSPSKLSNWLPKIKELSSNAKWPEIFSQYQGAFKSEGGLQMMTHPSFFHPILKACLPLSSFKNGSSILSFVIKKGIFEAYPSLQNSLMDFFIKSRNLEPATSVFNGMKIKDSVSWNIIINGYLNQEAGFFEKGLILFTKARGTGVFEPNVATLVLVVQACRAINDGLKIHGYVIKSGFCTVSSVQNSLLSFYAEDVGIQVARKLFDEMTDKDVVSWSVMIGGYAKNDESPVALGLFHEMVCEVGDGVDGQVMVSVLQACTSVGELGVGRVAHGFVIRKGMIIDLFVGNSLVDMYSKCSDVDSADKVFQGDATEKSCFMELLSGLVHNEKHLEAILFFDCMSKTDIQADEVTLVNLLQVCKYHLEPLHCKSIHCTVLRRGYGLNKLVINSLVNVYAKCNLISLAWILFCQMGEQDTITWSTMIAGFAHCGMLEEAFALYEKMTLAQANPNAVTMLSLIEACSSSGQLERSKWAHGVVVRRGFASEVAIGTAILDMYAKCGAVETSRRVFNQISQKNIVSWSAMIAAYGMNGLAHDALALFTELKLRGLKPNQVTVLSVLSACSHSGLVEEGISLFEELVQGHGVELNLEHYSCMVDLLGRAGKLDRAVELMETMPGNLKPGASTWGALLSGCRRCGNSELGVQAVSQVLELEPSNSGGYMLASGMFATEGSWVDAARMRLLVKERGVKVVAGHSLVHVNNQASRFIAGDKNHPLSDDIFFLVKQLHEFMQLDNRNDELNLNS